MRSQNTSSNSLAWLVMLGSVCLAAIPACDEGGDDGALHAVDVEGKEFVADPDRVCWDTLEEVPEGYEAIGDPEHHAFRILPKEGEATFRAEVAGTVTCTCTNGSGGCSPVSLGGSVGCFMGTSCNTCEKKVSKTTTSGS